MPNKKIKNWKDSLIELGLSDKEIREAESEIMVDEDIENVSDYGIHRQLDDAVWKAEPNRDYATVEDFIVNNPANTWQKPKPVTIICPSTLKGIVQGVKDAEHKNWKIRGLASCHSFSDAPRTKNCYIYLTDNDLINSIMGCRGGGEVMLSDDTKQALKNFDTFPENTTGVNPRYIFKKADLVEVAGGCTINELNDRLCRYDTDMSQIAKVRRLLNMGGGDVQTFAGAFATGTHGTGGKHSAYHDMIKSIVIVCTGGRVYRVEPANGITDRTKHEALYGAGAPVKIELIQDDDHFNSLLVSFGSFGIVHSAVIETTQMDLLHEELVYARSGYKDVKTKFDSLLPDFTNCRQDFFTNILINPYKLAGNADHSIITKEVRVAKGIPINRKEDRRNFWPTVLTGKMFSAQLIRAIAASPLNNKRRLIEGSLKQLNDHAGNGKNGYTDFSYRIWNAGGGETKSMGCGIEFAFRPNEVADVLADIFKLLDDAYKPAANRQFLNSPLSIRFVRSSEAYLAPNYKVHPNNLEAEQDVWCYIELLRINSRTSKDNEAEKEIFYKLQALLYLWEGRPHWGLNFGFPFTLEYLKKRYPKLDTWIESLNFFNPTGLFDNELTDTCGFRKA